MEDFYNSALNVIRSTRSMSLPYWGNVEIDSTKTSANDVVTKLDFEIESFLSAELSKLDLSIGFVGEEFGGDRSAERYWLVDPIDGTSHFVRGLPFCTTMVALVENGEVVFSAIYDFVNDTMYHAVRGGGAYQNNEPIRVSNRRVEGAYMFYESNIGKGNNLETYIKVRNKVMVLNTINAGYEFAMIATGKIEGRVCVDPYGKDYDFAPGTLLVLEAGGVVTNIGSRTFNIQNLNFIASNSLVHQALTEGADSIFPNID